MTKKMTYRKVKRMENSARYWRMISRRLFFKYGQLNLFTLVTESLDEWRLDCFDPNNGETHRYYSGATSRKDYLDLKKMLDLEIEICYKK